VEVCSCETGVRMKEIKAIIDPAMLSAVISALHRLAHFPGVTVSDAQGQGRGEGPGGKYVPHGPSWAFAKKTKVEIFCTDEQCEELIQAIRHSSRLGEAAHGIIMVSDVERVVRIRSGEQQDQAL
jgi:nitrogen regulatory protein P-II 1